MLKIIIALMGVVLVYACNDLSGKSRKKPDSAVLISEPAMQKAVFENLVKLTNKAIPDDQLNDSLAFLVLPVKLSCPACRRKTIDSIVKYQHRLLARNFIIISGSEGRRNVNAYFREVDKEMPVIENKLFLDSTNQAYKLELVKENPVIYYTSKQNAYKKVSAIPATVRDDLHDFFSGTHNINHSE
jgi:hypothetical protein